jgi:signal transduction histidine kinase
MTDFVVPTPWWRQPWAIATAAAAVVGGGIAASRGIVVARARRAIADLERQREREQDRARIARDIHDSLGAGLTRMALMSENARRAAHVPEDLQRRLDAIYRDAHGLARTVDEIVWAVNPLHDTLAGFIAFTMQDVEDSARAGGLDLDFDVPANLPEISLDAATRHHASLAVREAVQNVLRHAQAKLLRYRVRIGDDRLLVTVADDGRGFDSSAPVGDTQDGLKNIRCRIADLGGSVEIRPATGGGTEVVMHVPLAPSRPQAGLASGRPDEHPAPSAEQRHAHS